MSGGIRTSGDVRETPSDTWTCWQAGFLARIYRSQGRAPVFALASILVCGSSSRVSLARYDRELSSWRTSQLSLPGMEPSSLERLPTWGMTRDGVLYRLPTPEQVISGGDFFLWPTPTVNGNHNRKGLTKNSGDGLATAVKWPTPTASDFQSAKVSKRTAAKKNRPLREIATNFGEAGHLNPDWVEQLMGFPPGWTNPTCDFTSRDVGKSNTIGKHQERLSSVPPITMLGCAHWGMPLSLRLSIR